MGNFIDLAGQRFGRLLVIECVGKNKQQQIIWNCLCDCGNYHIATRRDLRAGDTQSCGCLSKEKSKERFTLHGLTKTRLGIIRKDMVKRCYNKKNIGYKNYGGRGIIVCKEWKNNPSSFFEWALSHGYEEHLTIDRIDNDGPYSPENCRWATYTEQMNNMSRNHNLTLNNETKSIANWSRDTGIATETIRMRLKYGWSIEEALTLPLGTRIKYWRKRKEKENE